MKLLETLWDRYKTVNAFEQSYWEGVVIASIMERAFRRAQEKFGEINSERINQAMESFRDEDFGGLMPNVTYTETNHEGSFNARIVKVHEDNEYIPLTTFFTPGKEGIKLLKR